jgi:hypothetical protein
MLVLIHIWCVLFWFWMPATMIDVLNGVSQKLKQIMKEEHKYTTITYTSLFTISPYRSELCDLFSSENVDKYSKILKNILVVSREAHSV